MLRRTLTILSLIGLLLSVGLLLVSYVNLHHGAIDETTGDWVYFSLYNGSLLYIHNTSSSRPLRKQDYLSEWEYGRSFACDLSKSMTLVKFPLWLPLAFFSTPVGVRYYFHHRRRKRMKLGLCLKCGYDLRASKDRCPECGEEFGSTGVAR